MNDCDRFRDLLIERLYGELSSADREALALHLAICEDCEAAAADYALIHSTSDEFAEPAPRAETVALLMSAAREEAAEARKVVPLFKAHRFLAPAMAAAAVLVLAFGGVVLYERFGDDAPGAAPDTRTAAAPVTAKAEERKELDEAGTRADAAEPSPFPAADRAAMPDEELAARPLARPTIEAGDGLAPADAAPGLASAKGGKAEGRTWTKPARKTRSKRDARGRRGGRAKAEKKKAEASGAGGAADRPARRYAEPPPPRPAPKAAATKAAPEPYASADDDTAAAPLAGASAEMGDAEAEEAPESIALAGEAPQKKSKRSGYRRRRDREAAPAEAAPMAEQARKPQAAEKSETITAGVLLSRARERKAAGDCGGALVVYDDLMLQFPGYRRMDLVWLEAAECHNKLGQKRKALELLDRLDRRYPAQLDRSRKLREELK